MDGQLVQTETPYHGDTVCVGCGAVRDPVETMYAPTSACLTCERRTADALLRNRMVR